MENDQTILPVMADKARQAAQGVLYNLQQLKKNIMKLERELDSVSVSVQRLRSKLPIY